MHLAAKLFEAHDRDRFVVHGFSYGPNRDDSMRRRVSSAFDSFHDINALGNAEAAVLARRENIDIAIDLTGNTSRSRSAIFAHRPAPIQINYLGFPGTMGAEFFDYIVADTTVIPEDQQGQFTERVMYLPHCCYVNDNTREISDRSMSRAEAGLPDRAFVFCCFNAPYKITPAEWDIWMRLLRRVQGSVLWLREPGERAVTNLRREALKRGIAADRLIFAEPLAMPEHLARHRLADLFLDTFNYNAHSTASDALWAGLPILTKAGRGFPTRVAASHLNALGLPELVVDSEPAYERLALELATSLEKLSGIRQKLNANRLSAPLFNTELFVRHFEDACEQVYQGYFEGKRPETVAIRSEP
jgi:protein O-GlcNAc transferase